MTTVVLEDATTGKPVELTPLAAAGAESRAYAMTRRNDRLALLPKAGGTYPPALGEKIKVMVEAAYSDPYFGFPLTWLREPHDGDGVYGYVVPKFPGSRADSAIAQNPPYGALLQAARRTVERFAASEALGIGQLDNHLGNFIWDYDPRAGVVREVYRIDPLPFEFWHKGRFHGCPLAHLDYLPPELQGVPDLADAQRGFECDRFALAALVFEILTGGHPAHYAWDDDPDAGGRIKNKLFACISPPPGATVRREVKTAFINLPAEVRSLLRSGLLNPPDQRPSPQQWAAALEPLLPKPAPLWRWPVIPPEWWAAAGRGASWLAENWNQPAAAVAFAAAAWLTVAPLVEPKRPADATPPPGDAYRVFLKSGAQDAVAPTAVSPTPPADPNAYRVFLRPTHASEERQPPVNPNAYRLFLTPPAGGAP